MQEKRIGSTNFQVTPFIGAEPFRLQAVLTKLLGPALIRTFMSIMTNGKTFLNKDWITAIADLSVALPGFMESLDENTYWGLIKRLLKGVIAIYQDSSGELKKAEFSNELEIEYTKVFQGKTLDIYKVIAFVLEVNYPDFFDLIRNQLGGFLKETIVSSTEEDKSS